MIARSVRSTHELFELFVAKGGGGEKKGEREGGK